ncbi:MAG: hypothetical protein KBS89_00835 [Bacteroidales bacterium]|nr:hypothetical protein [Candidatus Egerieousia equi]
MIGAGFIAAKFANKFFEKSVFKTIKRHAFWGALIMMLPDFGLGTIAFIFVLWHMYSKICEKCGISFMDNFWKLVGVGIFVNIAIALVVDMAMSVIFFFEFFIVYLQFYLSGKLFVESIKKMPLPKSGAGNMNYGGNRLSAGDGTPANTFSGKLTKCPHCALPVDSSHKFCKHCGKPIW